MAVSYNGLWKLLIDKNMNKVENERKREVKKLQHLIKGERGTETIWKKNRIYIGECISAIPGCLKPLQGYKCILLNKKKKREKKRTKRRR